MDTHYFKQYPEAEIDLHGMTREESLSELSHFLAWLKGNGFYYAKVITGKGFGSFNQVPIVRNAVLAYLNMEKYSYQFASMFDGGEGVIYVELH